MRHEHNYIVIQTIQSEEPTSTAGSLYIFRCLKCNEPTYMNEYIINGATEFPPKGYPKGHAGLYGGRPARPACNISDNDYKMREILK